MNTKRVGRRISDDIVRQKCDDLSLIFIRTYSKNAESHVVFKCPKHLGKGEIDAAWCHFKDSKYGCPYCSGKYKTTEDFVSEVSLWHPEIEVLGECVSMHTPIQVRCKDCGNIWSPEARSLKTTEGCPACGASKRATSRTKTHDWFVKEMATVAPHIQIVGKYTGTHKPVECCCVIHNIAWKSYPCNLLNKSAGCPMCAIGRFNNQPSKGERAIAQWLNEHGIVYKQEVSFDGLAHKRALRFDFYLPDENVAIEFDGAQHFEPVDYWNTHCGGTLEDIQKRDQIKNNYCQEHGISLIRIPYTEFENISEILSKNIIERDVLLS